MSVLEAEVVIFFAYSGLLLLDYLYLSSSSKWFHLMMLFFLVILFFMSFSSQEYPPGVMLVPMHSRTLKPFKTTNLVVFAPENGSGDHQGTDFVAHGDALIVDPGCLFKLHVEVCH